MTKPSTHAASHCRRAAFFIQRNFASCEITTQRRQVRQKDTAMTLKELRSKAFATRKQLELAQHNLREMLFDGSTWGQVWVAEQKVDRALDRMMRACNRYQNARK